jgi:hypothetical protein
MNVYYKKDIEKPYEEPTYRSIGTAPMFAIFRIGKKLKSAYTIRGFQFHMEREVKVINANPAIKNEILVGNNNIYDDAMSYLHGVKIHKNNVLAAQLLLTASPSFFQGLSHLQLEQWKAINVNWLQREFGENLRYAVLHKDETTWHIHALIIPKFKNKKNEDILSYMRYFDGKKSLSQWQDKYYNCIHDTFKQIKRGQKYSKATHLDIKKFYGLINSATNYKSIEQLYAEAANNDLLKLKIEAMVKTLDAYKKYNTNTTLENEELKKNLKELKKDKDYFEQVVSLMSKKYLTSQKELAQFIHYVDTVANKTR